jgi:CheY-like chemotaxis protein
LVIETRKSVSGVQRALAAGFQVHISKPMDPAAFVAAVAELAQLDRS